MENYLTHNTQLLCVLHEILKDHPNGIREYDLLVILKKKELPVFCDSDFSDTLDLFRAHFMLFHLLYILRDYLRGEEKGTVEIHFLKIVLLPWQSTDQKLPALRDTLAEYYGDLTNMTETRKVDVETMIDQFWKDYIEYHLKPKSLAVLGLDEQATKTEIKKRYRYLAKRHHPDHGGDTAKFNRISDAAQNLLR